MEIEGILQQKFEERTGVSQSTGNAWKIASYLVVIPGMYERKVAVEVSDGLSARIAQFDGLIGKEVVVSFDINAREYQGKWYNSVRAFGIKPKQAVAPAPPTEVTAATVMNAPTPAPATATVSDDDPPF